MPLCASLGSEAAGEARADGDIRRRRTVTKAAAVARERVRKRAGADPPVKDGTEPGS